MYAKYTWVITTQHIFQRGDRLFLQDFVFFVKYVFALNELFSIYFTRIPPISSVFTDQFWDNHVVQKNDVFCETRMYRRFLEFGLDLKFAPVQTGVQTCPEDVETDIISFFNSLIIIFIFF